MKNYLEQAGDMMEEELEESGLEDYESIARAKAKENDIAGMLDFLGELNHVHKEVKKGLEKIDKKYRATRKVHHLQIELFDENIDFYEWQLDVLKNEEPERELKQIMLYTKPLDIPKYDESSEYWNRLQEVEEKGEELLDKIDYYWDVYTMEEYWDDV